MDELLPGRSEGDFVEVPAKRASLKLIHVEGCLCGHVCLQTVQRDPDVKLIDARCIAAYLVPRGE